MPTGTTGKRQREAVEDSEQQDVETSSSRIKKSKAKADFSSQTDISALTGFEGVEVSQAAEVHEFFAAIETVIVTRDLSTLHGIEGYNKEEKGAYCTVETVRFNDVVILRHKLHHHIIADRAGIHEAREPSCSIESAIDQFVDPEPEKELVVYIMAKIMMNPTLTVKAKAAEYWATLMRMAHKKLWEEKSDWGAFLEDLKGKSTWSEEYQKTFATCLNGYKPRIPNTLHQIDREAVAVEKEIVQRAPEDVVILVVDKHHEILLSAFPEEWGLDFVMYKGFAKKLNDACQQFSIIRPPQQPDIGRHPLHEEWLKLRPQFCGKAECLQSGLYHMGIWTAQGRDVILWSSDSEENHELNVALADGALRAKDKALIPFFRCVAPDMSLGYTRVAKYSREVAGLKEISLPMADDSPFTMNAILINLHTVPHYDHKDWSRGLACITTVGEDFIDNDLIVRALGLQIPLTNGSVVFLRGQELRHSITKWNGKSKTSIVNFIPHKLKIEADKVAPKITLKINRRDKEAASKVTTRRDGDNA